MLGVRAYRGADMGNDHELVVAKIQLKLTAQKKTTKNQKLRSEHLLLPQFQDIYQGRYPVSLTPCQASHLNLTQTMNGRDSRKEYMKLQRKLLVIRRKSTRNG